MSISLGCPACNRQLLVPDKFGGKVIKCPKCSQQIIVELPINVELVTIPSSDYQSAPCSAPQQKANPFEFDDSPSEPVESRKPTKRSYAKLVMVFGVGVAIGTCLVVGGLTLYLFVPSHRLFAPAVGRPLAFDNQTERTRYRDYFAILEVSYELHAMIEMSSTWGRMYERVFKDLDAYGDVSEVCRWAKSEADALEDKQLMRRQDFTRDHGLNSTDFVPTFSKKFPERGLIFDEIDVIIRRIVADQELAVIGHLSDKRKEIGIGESWREYRRGYLRDQAPKFTKRVRDEVKKLASINNLRKKLYGKV